MPYLASISVYPIKSLDGIAVNQIKVLESGALSQDREFAILDAQGRFVNGKRNLKVHSLRSTWNVAKQTVCFQIQGTLEKQEFAIEDCPQLESWLSNYFGFAVTLARNSITGFPDDNIASGPTIISTATLETVASWFPGICVNEIRQRFRTNLEIDGVPPFWEDRLFTNAGKVVKFQIGEVIFEGINPCQRCIVPTRNSLTGESYSNFQKLFTEKRRETLPNWANASRFNHFYRLSINTKIPASEAGKMLLIGDELKLQN